MNTHPEQWAAIYAAAPREQLGVQCLAQRSDLSRGIEGGESAGHSLPPPTPAGPETQTRDLWVTSPTLYPLGHDCSNEKNEHSGSKTMICKLNMIGKLIHFDVSHYQLCVYRLYDVVNLLCGSPGTALLLWCGALRYCHGAHSREDTGTHRRGRKLK